VTHSIETAFRAASEFNLATVSQVRILLVIAAQESGIQQRDIAAATRLPKPNITRATQKMVALGYIARVRLSIAPYGVDGRHAFFFATPKGLKAAFEITRDEVFVERAVSASR